MKLTKLTPMFIILYLFFISCSTTAKKSEPEKDMLPSPVQINLIDNKTEAVFTLSLHTTGDDSKESRRFVHTLSKVFIIILDRKENIIDTVLIPYLDISGIGETRSKAISTMYGKGIWSNKNNINLSNYHFNFVFCTIDSVYNYIRKYNEIIMKNNEFDDGAALILHPAIVNLNDSTVEFSVTALRKKIIDGEYFPSSEMLRVELTDEKGKIVWSSQSGMNFLQVVKPVLPKEAGGEYKYTIEWNGKRNDGRILPAGTYIINFSLQVKPNNYKISMKYNRKLSDGR